MFCVMFWLLVVCLGECVVCMMKVFLYKREEM